MTSFQKEEVKEYQVFKDLLFSLVWLPEEIVDTTLEILECTEAFKSMNRC